MSVEAYDFYAILAPARTPRAVVTKLNAKITEVLAMPDIANRFAQTQFAEVVSSSPEELQRFIVSEVARWGKVIRDANFKAE